ncbi:MAG: lasso peptide biosynthesis B2 protein [Pseudomonadota bacterium]
MRFLLKFLKLKNKNKLLAIEVAFFLFIARLSILFLPYRFLKPVLGKYKKSNDSQNVDPKELRRISNYIHKISKYMPVKSNCLPQAITAKCMLKARNINSTLYIGLGKDKKNHLLQAHAWLKVNEFSVTGGINNTEYSEVAYFG